jgi:hypothetical protein
MLFRILSTSKERILLVKIVSDIRFLSMPSNKSLID